MLYERVGAGFPPFAPSVPNASAFVSTLVRFLQFRCVFLCHSLNARIWGSDQRSVSGGVAKLS
jgi:hypothetical protein